MSAPVTVTCYLDVLLSWCHWAEPAWAELKARYAGRVEFGWKIALMSPDNFPASREQCDWFFRRSGLMMRSPSMLSSGWVEKKQRGRYSAPNLVAEAGRDFGFSGDTLRLALAHAAMCEGRKIGGLDEAVAVAAKAGNLEAKKLRERAISDEVKTRVEAGTATSCAQSDPASGVHPRGCDWRQGGVFRPGGHRAARRDNRRHAGRHGRLRRARRPFRQATGGVEPLRMRIGKLQ